ncbi:Zinc/iron permease [Bombardia bombarda]|uniref:Zinc/iron permease n=1 Tax=Bombardia bombarda TaxID=252184 RepID=A0AA40CH77_9PEZI|nr:Zinc/iron permease [Bombardia bombarda]
MHRRYHQTLLAGRDAQIHELVAPGCETSTTSGNHWELRIASIFVILVGSGLGAIVPVFLARSAKVHTHENFFFVAKYFGSGVILATAWMHLLSPASDNLRDECLEDKLGDYDWAMAIGLMTVMTMFLLEIVVSRFDFGFGSGGDSHGHGHGHSHGHQDEKDEENGNDANDIEYSSNDSIKSSSQGTTGNTGPAAHETIMGGHELLAVRNSIDHTLGGPNHMAHQLSHTEGDEHANYAAQMTSLFILEFGVIFHSIFIGLTLAVTDNFIILFIVLVFHQTFEGLGLGARLGTATWPADGRRWTPYFLAGLYAISTPFAIGMGLIANKSLALEAATSKIVNGVFDAISGGILMYTGLVELLAHEFMFNPDMRNKGLKTQLCAYGCVALGVALMSVLAKWA